MECNKEEAIRAKELAEKKMETKEFASARRTALRAQRLCPDLKDISQMILICDVHCAAQNKVFGNESDWYGILQVDPTANEAVIKKQYRKLALSLHPDKNKLAGSSDAFKLIGEAHNLLSDNQQRMLFDSRCKAGGKYQVSSRASHQGNRQPNSRAHPWFQNNFMNNGIPQFMNQMHQQQKPQSGPCKNQPTFWTSCPFCSVRYQYYKEVVNKTLICQGCKKPFTCYEINAPIGTSGNNSSQPTFSQKRGPVGKSHSTAVPPSSSKGPSFKTVNPGSVKSEDMSRNLFPEYQHMNVKVDRLSKFEDSKKNSMKRNKSAESRKSCDTESSTNTEEDMNVEVDDDNLLRQNFGHYSQQNLRRSTRSKQQVSYDENLSGDDDEFVKASKRSKSCDSFCAGVGEVGNDDELVKPSEKSNGCESFPIDIVDSPTSASEAFDVPDAEFYNFDAEKSLEKFQVGQIWAFYSDEDALPKYYGMIKKIIPHPNFGLHLAWLVGCLPSEDMIPWSDKKMPMSCGKFKVGRRTQRYESTGAFSHQLRVQSTDEKHVYSILPQNGDVWALYKNWSDGMTCLELETCEYEIVEVLEKNDVEITVLLLERVHGFNSVFKPQVGEQSTVSMQVPWTELLRFSHQIPAFRLVEEKEGTLRGFWELDPAALPVNFFCLS